MLRTISVPSSRRSWQRSASSKIILLDDLDLLRCWTAFSLVNRTIRILPTVCQTVRDCQADISSGQSWPASMFEPHPVWSIDCPGKPDRHFDFPYPDRPRFWQPDRQTGRHVGKSDLFTRNLRFWPLDNLSSMVEQLSWFIYCTVKMYEISVRLRHMFEYEDLVPGHYSTTWTPGLGWSIFWWICFSFPLHGIDIQTVYQADRNVKSIFPTRTDYIFFCSWCVSTALVPINSLSDWIFVDCRKWRNEGKERLCVPYKKTTEIKTHSRLRVQWKLFKWRAFMLKE